MADYQNDMLGVAYQVKLKYLFIITIEGIPTYLCTKASRPKWSAGEVQLNYLNLKRYNAGKVTWDPISVTVTDAFTPSGAQAVMGWIRSIHEPLTGRSGYPANYMKDVVIHVLGPSGDVQEEWKLLNVWVQSADFGDLDMASESDPMQINLTLRYDRAILSY